jgi:hypothetical protein
VRAPAEPPIWKREKAPNSGASSPSIVAGVELAHPGAPA